MNTTIRTTINGLELNVNDLSDHPDEDTLHEAMIEEYNDRCDTNITLIEDCDEWSVESTITDIKAEDEETQAIWYSLRNITEQNYEVFSLIQAYDDDEVSFWQGVFVHQNLSTGDELMDCINNVDTHSWLCTGVSCEADVDNAIFGDWLECSNVPDDIRFYIDMDKVIMDHSMDTTIGQVNGEWYAVR